LTTFERETNELVREFEKDVRRARRDEVGFLREDDVVSFSFGKNVDGNRERDWM